LGLIAWSDFELEDQQLLRELDELRHLESKHITFNIYLETLSKEALYYSRTGMKSELRQARNIFTFGKFIYPLFHKIGLQVITYDCNIEH